MDENSLRRCFFAIPVQAEIQEALNAIVHDLKKHFHHDAHIRWIAPQNRHVTLRFLGNTTPQQIASLTNEIQTTCNEFFASDISFNLPLFFPSALKPRVLVLSGAPNDSLTIMANRLEILAQKNGFAAESRAFHAHLTLGRVKSSTNTVLNFADLSNYLPLKMKADKLILYQSVSGKNGVEYQVLKPFSLS